MIPRISIIVTTYNRKDLLCKTLNSILNQTYKNFEIIVIDNYSDYNFIEFIDSFNDMRITGYQNRNNGIISINRNHGLKLAKCELIALCDDDDIWHPDKLEKQLKIFDKYPDVFLCCTASSMLKNGISNPNKKLSSKLLRQLLSLNLFHSKYLLSIFSYITTSSVLFKSELLSVVGYFNEDYSIISVEDYDLWLRLSFTSKIYFLNEELVDYRIHDSQTSDKVNNMKKSKLEIVIKNNWTKMNFIQKLLFRINIIS